MAIKLGLRDGIALKVILENWQGGPVGFELAGGVL
jgi:hypothetical protein